MTADFGVPQSTCRKKQQTPKKVEVNMGCVNASTYLCIHKQRSF